MLLHLNCFFADIEIPIDRRWGVRKAVCAVQCVMA